MSKAILGFSGRTEVTPSGGAKLTLQSAKFSISKKVNTIEFTNMESAGYAEWAPTYAIYEISLEGVEGADATSTVNGLLTLAPKTTVRITIFLKKPDGSNYDATTAVLEEVSLNTEVKDVVRYSLKARVVGQIIYAAGSGVDSVTGYIV